MDLPRSRLHRGAQRGLVLALSASAGAHAALVPAHAAERPLVGVLFAISAVALAACAVLVDRHEHRAGALLAGLLLGSLLALYVASRVIAVWPLGNVEPVDALGVITKLFEVAGLVLALSLLQTPRSSDETLPPHREGASP